jgi:hypothetical protein
LPSCTMAADASAWNIFNPRISMRQNSFVGQS